jgi:hypothetical protein
MIRLKRNGWIVLACVAVVICGTGAAGYYLMHRVPDPANMNAQQIQKYMESQDFNSMPREQRRQFFEQVIDSRALTYFKTPEADREKYLDKIIDDMSTLRPRRPDAGADPNRPRDPNMFARFRNATPEQRRLRHEMQDPIKNQMRRQFMMAVGARAAQRGVQMGGFGGFRGGGPRG